MTTRTNIVINYIVSYATFKYNIYEAVSRKTAKSNGARSGEYG